MIETAILKILLKDGFITSEEFNKSIKLLLQEKTIKVDKKTIYI